MKQRMWVSLALGGALTLTVVADSLAFVNPIVTNGGNDHQLSWVLMLYSAVYLVLGSLLVWQRPHELIPWLLLSLGVVLALSAPSEDSYGLAHEASQRAGVALYVVFGTLFALLVQLFPTGHELPGRWSWATRLLVVGSMGLLVGVLLGIGAPTTFQASSIVIFSVLWSWAVGMIGSIPVLFVRFYRSEGIERAQLKWYLYSIAITLVLWFLPFRAIAPVTSVVAPLLPALAITVALLRYRLYDIDRVISRTTAYAIVTGMVLAMYFAVLAIASLLPTQSPSLVVAAATLAAAAAFRPALQWVQTRVDRRFNRSGYDASRVVEQFGHHLRSEVNAETIETNLMTAVRRTLQPTDARLWLRPMP